MPRSIGPRTTRTTVTLLAIALLAVGCGGVQQAAKQAPKYGDDVIKGVGKVFGKSADDAAKYLDDAKQAGRFAPEAEVAVATWSTRVGTIADDLVAKHIKVPEDQAAARSLVVGTTCDAFAKLERKVQASQLPILTNDEIRALVDDNRVKSLLPDLFSRVMFVVELVDAIDKAIRSPDLTASFPAIARLTTCEVLG